MPRTARAVVSVRVPEPLRQRLNGLVGQRGLPTRAAALTAALEKGLRELAPAADERPREGSKAKPERLELLRFRVGCDQARRLRAYAEACGHSSLSDALAHLVGRALDEEEGRAAVPAQKADELAEALRSLAAVVGEMGPGVLGLIRLLAHWAAKSGGLKVSEDEILAEIWSVGGSEWAQLFEDLAAEHSQKDRTH